MNPLRFDAQHITLLVVALITAFGPAIAAAVTPGTAAIVVAVASGLVILANTILSVFKTSPKDVVVVNAVKKLSVPPPPMPPSPPMPPINPASAMLAFTFAFVGLGAVVASDSCALFQGKGPQIAVDVGQMVACVLEHDQLPASDIANACGGLAIQDVLNILASHKAAMKREMPAGCVQK